MRAFNLIDRVDESCYCWRQIYFFQTNINQIQIEMDFGKIFGTHHFFNFGLEISDKGGFAV